MAFDFGVFVVYALVSVLSASFGVSGSEFPINKIQRCNYGDTECIRNVAEYVLQTYSEGIPELQVGPLDPIDINNVKIENPGFVSIDLTLDKVKMSGLSKSKVKSVKGFEMNFDENAFNELEIFIPRIVIHGPYSIDGKVFFIPISGNGITNLTLDDLTLNFKFHGKRLTRDSNEYLRAEDMDLDMSTSRLYLQFDNLFNGDKFLGEQTNAFLNRRWEDIFKEVKPKITKVFADEITDRINEAFSQFPYQKYFLPAIKSDLTEEAEPEIKPELKLVDLKKETEEKVAEEVKPEVKAEPIVEEAVKEEKEKEKEEKPE